MGDTASNHKCFDSSNEPQKYFYSAKKTLQKCHESCATCSDETAAKCKSCADKYKKKSDKTKEYECFNSTPIGYWDNSSDSDNYTKCSSMCDTCANGTTCTACQTHLELNYKKKVDDTASNHKCFDSSNEPQKYFYSAKKTLQKCHGSCATCSDETAAKCKSCADTYKKIADKTGEYQCYNSKPYPAGYWNKASE